MGVMESRRALLMSAKEGGLPTGFKKLKYLESSGHQYINIRATLGTTPPVVPKAVLDVQMTALNIQQGLFGFWSHSSGKAFSILANYGDKLLKTILINGNYMMLQYPNDTQRHKVIFTVLYNGQECFPQLTIDGVTNVGGFGIGWNSNASWAQSALFACGYYPSWAPTMTADYFAHMKSYSASFYTDDDIVRDFIPAQRTIDGKVGMFDKVSGTFFINEGSGEFGYETDDGIYVAPV